LVEWATSPLTVWRRGRRAFVVGGRHGVRALWTDVAIEELRAGVDGPVLLPGDDGYAAETTPWNRLVEHHPAVAVGVRTAADVAAAVRFAGRYELPVAVVGGGHGAWTSADAAVLINTRRMDRIVIDVQTGTARIGAGVLAQELADAAAEYALAPLVGSAPDTGAVAFTLGGGLSPTLGRLYGYAADHVRAFEIVTADGEVRHVNADSEPDLFWAVRGGKGNFGVVTALEVDLFLAPTLYGGTLFFTAADTRPVLEAWQQLVKDAPDELSTSFALLRPPPRAPLPEPLRDFVLAVRVAYVGSPHRGAELLTGLRAAGTPVIDTVAEMPFRRYAEIHGDPAEPVTGIGRGTLLGELAGGAVDAILAVAGPDRDFPVALTELRHLGGALGRLPRVPNAVGHRDAQFALLGATMLADPADACAAHERIEPLLRAMMPWHHGGSLLNMLGDADHDFRDVRRAFEPLAYAKLAALKSDWDATNMFRVNHNIPPRG
jgi:FAD/FMN-containing dehydrogenase